MRKSFIGSLLLLLALLTVACGGTTLTPPQPQPTSEGEVAAPDDEGGVVPRGIGDVAGVTALVLEQLAAQTGLSLDSFTVADVTEQEWPDAGLGCPAPGESYMQVITPGYQFTVEGGDETFDVRTNEDGSLTIICDADGIPLGVPDEGETDIGAVPVELPEALGVIPQRLADEMGFDATDLALVTLEETEWTDTSLGCPDIATTYLQVITPGYRLQFETPDGETFNVNASRDGSFVLCGPDNAPILVEYAE